MEPGQYAVDDLASVGGLYQMTVSYKVSRVARNGVDLTEDTSAPGTNDHWYYDETNALLKIKLASAPHSSTNVIIVYYHIFLTGEKGRRIPQDPEDSTSTLRQWHPRILNYPNFSQSVRDILNGTLSISQVNIELENADYYFNEFLKPDWSLYQKSIEVWLCINSYSNRMKVFKGQIADAKIQQNVLRINLFDPLNKLKQKALMDTSAEAYFLKEGSSFPNIHENDNGKPVTLIMGRYSPYKTKFQVFDNGGGTFLSGDELDYSGMLQAVCTDATNDITDPTNNREWGLCRFFLVEFPAYVDRYFKLGTITAGAISGQILELTTSGHNVRCGMTIVLQQTTAPIHTDYLKIVKVTSTKIYAAVTSAFTYTGYSTFTEHSGFSSGCFLAPYAGIVWVRSDNTVYYPLYGRDYQVTYSNTTNGNLYIKITFEDSTAFETNFGFAGNDENNLHPQNDKIYFVAFSNYENSPHETVVERLLDQAGVDYNAASITAAGTALTAYVNFTIPYKGSNEYGNYLDYLQDLMGSVGGYLSLNSSFEITYNLLAAPSSTTATTLDHILLGSISADYDYQDIVDEVIFYNEYQVTDPCSLSDNEDNYYRVQSNKSKYLHDVVATRKRKHLIEGATARCDQLAQIVRNKQVTYRYKTASKDLDARLGDDITLEGEFVTVTGESDNLFLVGISTDGTSTTLEASDLGDL
jgi:hypothetical protein